MSNWNGIPAELHPQPADIGILTRILANVIEARAIYRDFFFAQVIKAGERHLPHKFESDFARVGSLTGPFQPFFLSRALAQFGVVQVAPSKDWNAQIDKLAANSKVLAQGIRSPGLKAYLLKPSHMFKNQQYVDRLFWVHIERSADVLRQLQRPDPLDRWFAPGHPDRLIRFLRGEYPRH